MNGADECFEKVLKERAEAALKYLQSLDKKGVTNNTEAQEFHAIITDSDRHLKALIALGAASSKLPPPVNGL